MEQVDDGDGLAAELRPERILGVFVVNQVVLNCHDVDLDSLHEQNLLLVRVGGVDGFVHSEPRVSSICIPNTHDQEDSSHVDWLLLAEAQSHSHALRSARVSRDVDVDGDNITPLIFICLSNNLLPLDDPGKFHFHSSEHQERGKEPAQGIITFITSFQLILSPALSHSKYKPNGEGKGSHDAEEADVSLPTRLVQHRVERRLDRIQEQNQLRQFASGVEQVVVVFEIISYVSKERSVDIKVGEFTQMVEYAGVGFLLLCLLDWVLTVRPLVNFQHEMLLEATDYLDRGWVHQFVQYFTQIII